MSDGQPRTIVWDWAIRLFHWLIVLLIPLMWWTAEESMMDWHRRIGLTLVGILIFRLMWGFIGSWTARFVPMVKSIKSVPGYFQELISKRHRPSFGHSPMAVLSVFALLGSMLVQLSTGLFSVDVDGLESGPLAILVSFDIGREIADIHELNFNILLALIALHIIAIITYHMVLKDKLVEPMVKGSRPASDFAADDKPDIRVRPLRFVIAVLVAVSCVYAITNAG